MSLKRKLEAALQMMSRKREEERRDAVLLACLTRLLLLLLLQEEDALACEWRWWRRGYIEITGPESVGRAS
jgi:hypothetical protein